MLENLNEQVEYKVVLEVADKIIHGRLRKSLNTSLISLESEREENPFGGTISNRHPIRLSLSGEELKEES